MENWQSITNQLYSRACKLHYLQGSSNSRLFQHVGLAAYIPTNEALATL